MSEMKPGDPITVVVDEHVAWCTGHVYTNERGMALLAANALGGAWRRPSWASYTSPSQWYRNEE